MLYINPALLAQVYIRWYSDPTKAMQSIRMSRSISVFASPTGLGYFSLLGILYFYNDVGKPNWLILLFFTILGMFSISKTFVLGLPLAILLSVNRSTFKTKNVFRIVAMIFLVVVILLCLQRYLYGFVDSLNYLGSQLNSGETIFGTRYNGLLIGMEDQIRETFPSGVGFVKKQLNDVFIGDSGYLIMLLWAGLPGFLLYYSSILILGTESSSALKYILIALVVELGRPALWGTRVSDVLWIIIGMEMSTGREGYD